VSEAPWRLQFAARAERDLRRLDRSVRVRVYAALERLLEDPHHAGGLRRLSGRPESRLRVGDWRVILQLDAAERVIYVKQVLPRGRAYDR
jgi:mRNA interferase RelE/StbE